MVYIQIVLKDIRTNNVIECSVAYLHTKNNYNATVQLPSSIQMKTTRRHLRHSKHSDVGKWAWAKARCQGRQTGNL